eukprot:511548-Prymnesium_polylepis.1
MEARGVARAAWRVQRGAWRVRRGVCGVVHAVWHVRRAACGAWRRACGSGLLCARLHLQLLRVVGTTEMHRARRLVGGGELRLHRLELRPEALRLRLRLRLARGARVVVRVVAALAQLLNLLQQRLLRRAQLLDQLRVGLRLAPALQLAHARLQRQGEG